MISCSILPLIYRHGSTIVIQNWRIDWLENWRGKEPQHMEWKLVLIQRHRLTTTSYLELFPRYWALNISRTFRVTWRHRPREHSFRIMWFPIDPLFWAVFGVLCLKHIRVTTLTFRIIWQTDVIGHVIIRFAIYGFLWVLRWYRHSISNRLRDIEAQTYLGHDLDLSRSHNDISHMTIRFAAHSFLYVLRWQQPAVLSCFWDIEP